MKVRGETYTDSAESLDVRIEFFNPLDDIWDSPRSTRGRADAAKECTKRLLLLGCVWWIPVMEESGFSQALAIYVRREDLRGYLKGLAVEEIGHENLVLMVMVTSCEDVGTLEGLREIAEDVKYEEDGRGC